jgi:hypothetical protein
LKDMNKITNLSKYLAWSEIVRYFDWFEKIIRGFILVAYIMVFIYH